MSKSVKWFHLYIFTPDSQVRQNHIGPFHLTCCSVEASTVVPHEPRAEMQASVRPKGPIANGNFFTLSDKGADDLIHLLNKHYSVVAGTVQEKEKKRMQSAWTLPDLCLGAMHWWRQVQPPWVQDRAEQATTEAYTRGGGVCLLMSVQGLRQEVSKARQGDPGLTRLVRAVVAVGKKSTGKTIASTWLVDSGTKWKEGASVQYCKEVQEDDSQVNLVPKEPPRLRTTEANCYANGCLRTCRTRNLVHWHLVTLTIKCVWAARADDRKLLPQT